MSINKKTLAAAIAAGTIGTAGITASVMAATDGNTGSSYPPIVQKIADRFHLNPADVNGVFKEQHQENMDKRQAKLKSYLDQKVKDGKITQDQENKILDKLKSLHDEFKTDSKQDRRQNHRQMFSELQQWAKDNGINLDDILPHPAGMHQPESNS